MECLQDYLQTVVLANDKEWKVLQADVDSAFISKQVTSWLTKKSIRLQLSVPYKHSQNGMVERDMQFLIDKARSMMSVYNTPPKFWGCAIQCACDLINLTHTPAGTELTPHEMITGDKPDVSKLIPFYAPGVYHLTKDERKKNSWKFKAEPCRFLGYDHRTKHGVLLLKCSTNKIVTRDDYVFDVIYLTALREAQLDPTDNSVQEFFLNQEIESEPLSTEDDSEVYESVMLSIIESNDYATDALYEWYNHTVCTIFGLEPLPPSPKSVTEALEGPNAAEWRIAIDKELIQMEDVFATAEQSGPGMKVKLVLKVTYDNEFNVKFKARLVGCGYSHRKGIDYVDTYAPTISTIAVYSLLHISVDQQYKLASFDVSGAFLESLNDYENHAWLPPGLFGHKLRVRLNKAIYGEKQSAKLWHDKMHEILIKMGFQSCPVTNCLYQYKKGEDIIIMTVHVDDGLIAYNNETLLQSFSEEINKHLEKLTIITPVKRYLGVNIDQRTDEGKILLSQTDKIDNMIREILPTTEIRNEKIPMAANMNLRKSILNINNESLLSIVGKLRFIADRTRFDILNTTGELGSKGATTPSEDHINTAIKCLNYLRETRDLTLTIGELQKIILFGFTDASYNPEGESKSRMGGSLFLGENSGSVYNYSRTTTLVTQSSTHAEIMAADELIKHTIFLRDILDFLGHMQLEPTKIYCDSKSAIEICNLFKTSHKTSSINMRINYIKQCIDKGLVTLVFVNTKKNVADVLTKPLPEPLFAVHVDKIMNGFGGKSVEEYVNDDIVLTVDSVYLSGLTRV